MELAWAAALVLEQVVLVSGGAGLWLVPAGIRCRAHRRRGLPAVSGRDHRLQPATRWPSVCSLLLIGPPLP